LTDIPSLWATSACLAGYGTYIGSAIDRPGLSIPFYKGSVQEGHNYMFQCVPPVTCRSARLHKRADNEAQWLERHMNMTQMFVGLGDQPFLMVLGRPTHVGSGHPASNEAGFNPNLPYIKDVRAFLIPAGQGVLIEKGTWHDFPVSIGQPVTVLTFNSDEVVKALASMKAPAEMDHGDVYKIDIKSRMKQRLMFNLHPTHKHEEGKPADQITLLA